MVRHGLVTIFAALGILSILGQAQAESLHVLKGRIIRSLAVDPTDPNHVLVGQKGANAGSGLVFQSFDGGKSWLTLNGNRPLSNAATDVQAVLALSKETLFAGTWKHGLYRSTDGGRNFVKLTNFPSADIRDLQTADGVIYAATGADGVFSSEDLGESWQALGPGKDFLWSLSSAGGKLFASSPASGVFEMDGASWSKVFSNDKAYAFAESSAWQAVAGETALHMTSGGDWTSISSGEKFADVMIIDDARLLAASWSNGVAIVAPDGAVTSRLLEGQAALHLVTSNDQLLVGTWGKGLHILPLADLR